MFTKRGLIFICFLFFVFFSVFSQHTNFSGSNMWRFNKKEIFIGGGSTHFLSDLGGRNQIGTQYSPIDIDIPGTRYMGNTGFRYRFSKVWATRTVLTYAKLFASDQLTAEPARNNRNLQVKTNLYEVSQYLELIVFSSEFFGKRYNIPGIKGSKGAAHQVYIFSGLGGFLYVPKTLSGVNLRPLNTEGQGLPGGAEEYGLYGLCVPFGVGYKFAITNNLRLGVEINYRMTFTDYLDDVSTVYYDKEVIREYYGDAAANYADPNNGSFPTWTNPGEKRGDPNYDDAYVFFTVNLYKNISYKSARKYNTRKRWRMRPSASF